MRPTISPLAAIAALLFAGPAFAQPELVASTDARTPEEERAALHLPPGFAIQLVAAEPDIQKPMNLAFDERGRLWVTSSVEYPFPAEGEPEPRDRVTILADFGPDGRARSITRFAEDLNIPIGVLPLSPREALVYTIPNVLKLTDTDGDGRADAREVVLETYGHKDTHGMTNAFTLGYDGWVYACHGFANTSTVRAANGGAEITMNSGNTYRFRPDGTAVEQWTWGQVNPFGLALDSLGNLWSCDCHTMPIYHLLRGAYYPSFGKPDDGLGYGPRMMEHSHGSTGIAGIVRYEADHFPDDWRDTIFVGNPVTSRINHDRIEWTGSTPKAVEQPDFLISDDPWFRPVDIELGPDGALYIADFYNKIIGHYEVPLTHPGRDRERGRIWRIVWIGEDGASPPPSMPRDDWGSATVDALIDDLGHPNLAVRLRAIHELSERPDAAVAIREGTGPGASSEQRVGGLWALQRLGELPGGRLVEAIADGDRAVRVHAMRLLAERPSWADAERYEAVYGLADADPFVRRAAADAIGRHPRPVHIPHLLAALHAADPLDTHLVHVLRMALRDQLRDPEAWASLPEGLGNRERLALADVAPGVPSTEAAAYLLEHTGEAPAADLERFVTHIARHGAGDPQPALRAAIRASAGADLGRQLGLLRALQRGLQQGGRALDEGSLAWVDELAAALLVADDPRQRIEAVELVGSFRIATLVDEIDALIADRTADEAVRLAAIDARLALDADGAVPILAGRLATADEPSSVRERAAAALGRAGSGEGRAALLDALPIAPSGLQARIALALTSTPEGSVALLAAVEAGKASPRVLQEPPVQIQLNNAGIADLEARISTLTAGLPPADDAWRALLDARLRAFADDPPGPETGLAVFEQHCAACHQLGGKGGKVGPQLDGVGQRGAERLMEDVLNPNRNVDQAFRTTVLALADGRVLSGLLLSDEGEVFVLADVEGKEVRVAKAEVDERQTTPLSPMPSNFAERIPDEEFRRLIAYLLDQRAGAE